MRYLVTFYKFQLSRKGVIYKSEKKQRIGTTEHKKP